MDTLHIMIYSGHIQKFFLFQYTYPNHQATPAFLQYQHLSSLPWHSVTQNNDIHRLFKQQQQKQAHSPWQDSENKNPLVVEKTTRNAFNF